MDEISTGQKFAIGGGIFGVILLLVGLAWFGEATNYEWFAYWAPKYANVQRQVFENTDSYSRGMAQEVQDYRMQYATADAEHKKALRTLILHDTAGHETQLPADDQQWLNQLQAEQDAGK